MNTERKRIDSLPEEKFISQKSCRKCLLIPMLFRKQMTDHKARPLSTQKSKSWNKKGIPTGLLMNAIKKAQTSMVSGYCFVFHLSLHLQETLHYSC